jgi:hypothetical protein
MAKQHTSGAWRADESGEIRAVSTHGGWPLVARVVFSGLRTSPKWRANAKLIAAAPEMLETLLFIRQCETLKDAEAWPEAMERLNAAIDKASP